MSELKFSTLEAANQRIAELEDAILDFLQKDANTLKADFKGQAISDAMIAYSKLARVVGIMR